MAGSAEALAEITKQIKQPFFLQTWGEGGGGAYNYLILACCGNKKKAF